MGLRLRTSLIGLSRLSRGFSTHYKKHACAPHILAPTNTLSVQVAYPDEVAQGKRIRLIYSVRFVFLPDHFPKISNSQLLGQGKLLEDTSTMESNAIVENGCMHCIITDPIDPAVPHFLFCLFY